MGAPKSLENAEDEGIVSLYEINPLLPQIPEALNLKTSKQPKPQNIDPEEPLSRISETNFSPPPLVLHTNILKPPASFLKDSYMEVLR